MSSFETAISAAYGDLREAFGVALTYTPAGGSPVSVADGTFEEDLPAQADRADGRQRGRTATATVPQATVATAAIGDVVTVGGEEWAVTEFRSVGGGEGWELRLERSEIRERTTGGPYRLR